MTVSDQIITLTRQEFYERIWTTPISKLAKEFGVKRGDILALCEEHQIPRPALSYWPKARHGKAPTPTPLPETPHDCLPVRIAPDIVWRAYQREKDEKRYWEIVKRVHREQTEEAHWERLLEMAGKWRQANAIRSFLTVLNQTVDADEKARAKAEQLTRLAENRLRLLDPVSYDPADFFEIIEEPIPAPDDNDLAGPLHDAGLHYFYR